MDAQEIRKAHILGFSDGANIAMIFAIRYPEYVDRLILNGGNLNAGGVKRSTQIPIEIGYKIASKFAEKSEDVKKNSELLGLMVNDPNIEPAELSAIKAKALVIAGSKDMIKEAHTKLIASSIPDAKLILIDGTHFIANKKSKEFNKVVMEFLSQ